MKATVDSLLEPISAEHPCGEDIGYDPQFIELDTFLQGREETQFAAAEEPDWKAIMERCLALFQRSKDLRIALRLSVALLKMEGLPGFRDGLVLLKGLVERYWDPVYPRLELKADTEAQKALTDFYVFTNYPFYVVHDRTGKPINIEGGIRPSKNAKEVLTSLIESEKNGH